MFSYLFGSTPLCFGSLDATQLAIKRATINLSNNSVTAELLYTASSVDVHVVTITSRFIVRDEKEWMVSHEIHAIAGKNSITDGFRDKVEEMMTDTFSHIFDEMISNRGLCRGLWKCIPADFVASD